MTAVEVAAEPAASSGPPGRRRRAKLLDVLMPTRRPPVRRGRTAIILSAVWVGLVVLVALTVQWLPLHDPALVAGSPNLPPNLSAEFLGTDVIGRSELSRLAYGARASLGISLMACAISLTIGSLLGLVTAYVGSWFTSVVDVVTNALLAVPSLLLLLAIVLALQPTVLTLTLALSLIFIPQFMRLTRARAKTEITREYVIAARMMGASGTRVMFREVLPNSFLHLISYAALVVPSLMVTEGALSFLGHGVQPPTPSWGAMIAEAQPFLTLYPWPALTPCIVLFLTVFALNILGDALRVKLDVRDAQL